MSPDVERIFDEVADLSAEERARYFSEHAVDARVRREVESLLLHDAGSSARILAPIATLAGSLGADRVGRRCGPYELKELIGRGGMGSVYRAERVDGEVRRSVAVKLMQGGSGDPVQRMRFLQERQILASLSHPNIAGLLDAGHSEDGQPYFVMELVEGKRIDEFCVDLPLRQSIALFLKVCDAVSFAHSRLVVHRDLKPSNILVTPGGEPKLLDFGIAKLLDLEANETMTIERAMTPAYGSPEQASGEAVTTATDTYSLGAVLYKILTGRPPHEEEGSTPAAMLTALLTKDVVRPSQAKPALAGDIDAIVMKALRKEPDKRYSSVDQLADDLRRYLESRPIRAREGESLYRIGKFMRRYWIPVTASLAAIVALTVGLLVIARERQIADRRFRLVRELAGNLFVIDDRIAPLPGSTDARRYIADTALRYLYNIGSEATEPDLMLEVADAYRRTADVLSRRGRPSLGLPKEAFQALENGDRLLERALAAHPKDQEILRAIVTNRMRAMSVLSHGDDSSKALEISGVLTKRVEQFSGGSLKIEDLLLVQSAYSSLGVAYLNGGRVEQARKYAELSVEFARLHAEGAKTPEANLAYGGALRIYGTFLRYDGQLEKSLEVLEKALRVVNPLPELRGKPGELGNVYYFLGIVNGEVDSLSLGRMEPAIEELEQSLAIGRRRIAEDPKDQDAKLDFAQTALKLGRILDLSDPARALSVYDEAYRTMSAAPAGAANRENYLVRLGAESTFSLRTLGRSLEAKRRMTTLAAFLPKNSKTESYGPTGSLESYYRAEAEMYVVAGDVAAAIKIYRGMLSAFAADKIAPREDLADALGLSLKQARLAQLLRKSGQDEEAGRLDAQRRELWTHWDQRLPNNTFVRRQVAEASRQN